MEDQNVSGKVSVDRDMDYLPKTLKFYEISLQTRNLFSETQTPGLSSPHPSFPTPSCSTFKRITRYGKTYPVQESQCTTVLSHLTHEWTTGLIEKPNKKVIEKDPYMLKLLTKYVVKGRDT